MQVLSLRNTQVEKGHIKTVTALLPSHLGHLRVTLLQANVSSETKEHSVETNTSRM